MKRDLDLIRKILLEVESCDNPNGIWDSREIKIEGYRDELTQYNVSNLITEGFLVTRESIEFLGSSSVLHLHVNLTWAGHEFLDNAKNESVWQTVKKDLGSKWDSVSFSALQTLLDQAALKILEAL